MTSKRSTAVRESNDHRTTVSSNEKAPKVSSPKRHPSEQSLRQRVEDQLEEVSQRIDEIKAKAKALGAGAREDLDEMAVSLTEKRAATREKLRRLAEAGEDAWDEAVEGLEGAWSELREGLSKAVAKLKKM